VLVEEQLAMGQYPQLALKFRKKVRLLFAILLFVHLKVIGAKKVCL
jgi:hypothetical protein